MTALRCVEGGWLTGIPQGFRTCFVFEDGPEMRVRWQVRTLEGHADGVASVAFSLDGRFIVSGSWDKLVKFWNAATGAEVSSFVGLRCVW